MKKCAVFSCKGLGDGLIALVLSNNLHLNGYHPVTFHPFLHALQSWFPHLPLSPFGGALEGYERYFIIYEKSSWMQDVLNYCESHFPEKTTVLNPIATRRRDYPYWEGGKFDGSRSFVENLYRFSQEELHFKVATRSNGITPPDEVEPRLFSKRIILHPTSSREGKNWPREKYLQLAKELRIEGYDPLFALTREEQEGWDLERTSLVEYASLTDLAKVVCESGLMIGNDSGIGHLASCLGVPTVTICRSPQAAQFWRPSWERGEVVTPSPWIPNLKGTRWRDRHWKKWISVKKVLKICRQWTN